MAAIPTEHSRSDDLALNVEIELESSEEEEVREIKTEITVEAEKITETTYLANPVEQVDQLCQIEVQTTVDEEKKHTEHDWIEIVPPSNNKFISEESMEINESQLSDVLSDHNYTSQELMANKSNLSIKDALRNHFEINRAPVETNFEDVNHFIDGIVDEVKKFQLKVLHEPVVEESNHDQTDDTHVQLPSLCSSPKPNFILPENCSEPLEIEAPEACFKTLFKTTEIKSACKTSTFKRDVMDFARDLYKDCISFSSKSEKDIYLFLKGQIKKLKNIAEVLRDSPQVQNSSANLKNNQLWKDKLLLDSSCSSDSDSIRTRCNESKPCSPTNNDKGEGFVCNLTHIQSSSQKKGLTSNAQQDYMDGIDLSKYIELEFKGRSSSLESNKENTEVPDLYFSSDDDIDKEIDRLIDLRGLKKRYGLSRPSKHEDKNKKLVLRKRRPKSKNSLKHDSETCDSDNSYIQSEEEVLTENQYLSRYNEQIKMQLLNDSSSDSGLSDQSSNLLSKESSSGDEESKKDVVDKFLQTFHNDSNDCVLDDSKELKPDDGSSKKDACNVQSNDEMLETDYSHIKKSTLKPLEQMISDVEKRHKNDEIILSSESDYSDAEVAEKKTRFIKPMLRMDQLARETRIAQKSESERIRKLEKKQSIMSKAIKSNSKALNQSDLILDYLESSKTFIKVEEELVKLLKLHQKDGIQFMYNSCFGGIDHSKKDAGSGCILAHCMGLGKTLQLIALLHTVTSYKELNINKVLVLCPKSTVMNWSDEFHRWLGPLEQKNKIKVFGFQDSSDITDKIRILEAWSITSRTRPGCLIAGYEAFRSLVFYHSYKNRGNFSQAQLNEIREKVNENLLQPGADLVVCDEGHIIKNSKSAISLAVSQIVTPKRIILTGTPIQNNLKEYYSMVNFIKPLYLGTEKEFANLYANPIKNGQHKDSSKKDITVMKQRSYVLHKKLSKFVQRKEAELLKTFLPQKFEYVLFIPMTEVQNKLYEYILEAIANRNASQGRSLITDYTVLRKIWTHPRVLEDAWKNSILQKNKKDAKKLPSPHSDDDQPDDIYDSQTGVISVTNDWWRRFLSKKDLETIMPSSKLRTMFFILRMCEEQGDKCLIFSAFVAVLNVVEYFFKKITECDPEMMQYIHFSASQSTSNTWINGQDYYRLDGKTPKNIRHEMIKRFNTEANKRARVFLISSKAGGQGINLIGANRVIILDTSWNPSNDQQNIFRIFRLGQKKNCYIYRLIALGTMEEKVYSRSVTKQAMSFRVVDEQQIDRHYNMAELAELYTLTKPQNSERTRPVPPKDNILAHLLLTQPDLVFKYHEHDSLLENKVEQELSEQEKADAWATYEREVQMSIAPPEGLNTEKTPNPFLTSKINPYYGMLPGLDMQTLLSYSLQSPSIIPQYGYGINQSYLDALNMYQKYSQMRYSDINDKNYPHLPFGGMSSQMHNHLQAVPPVLPGMGATKPMQNDFAQKPRSSSHESGMLLPSSPHPLSSDISTSALIPPNVGLTTAAQAIHSNLAQYKQLLDNPLAGFLSNYPAHSYPPISTVSTNPANQPIPLKPYNLPEGPVRTPTPKKLDDSENTTQKEKVKNKSKALDELSAHKMNTPIDKGPNITVQSASSIQNLSAHKKSTIVDKGPNSIPQTTSTVQNLSVHKKSAVVDKGPNITPQTANTIQNLPAHKKNTPIDLNITAQSANTLQNLSAHKKSIPVDKGANMPAQSASTIQNLSSHKKTTPIDKGPNNATQNVSTIPNLPKPSDQATIVKSLPPTKIVPAQNSSLRSKTFGNAFGNEPKKVKATTNTNVHTGDILKNNLEMQIIPTSSPPGTSSITKQLNEMSPSISVTAVTSGSLRDKTAPNTNLQQHAVNLKDPANMVRSAKNLVNPKIISNPGVEIQKPRSGLVSSVQAISAARIGSPVTVKKITNPQFIGNVNIKELSIKTVGNPTAANHKLLSLPKTLVEQQPLKIRPDVATMNISKNITLMKPAQKLSAIGGFITEKKKITDISPKTDNSSLFVRKRSLEGVKIPVNPKRPKLPNDPK